MAKRTIQRDPELLAHQQWLGYLQPVGLVVAPAAMQDAGWVVARSGSELIERQQRYRDGLEPLGGDDDDADERELGFTGIETLLVEQLGWGTDQVQSDPKLIEDYTRELPELGETLQPTAVVPVASGEGAQLLVQELPLLTPLDQKLTAGEHLWRASPQERFERLLRETGVEAGLLFNGAQLRLVVAPKGESSGYLTFPLADLAEVSGRLMFSGLDLLLGQSHVFLDPDGYRLSDVLKKSRSFQAVVSNALADQVLAALWDLLRGFQQADELSQRQDIELLGDLPERDAQQLYGGLITMLMRLVFLLYAEDEALMPSDAVYEQNYKLSGIYEQLQQNESEYPDTMEQRFGAWAGLMSLCRLVFDGGGPTADYLPARHGQLFDPAVYPWLESPWISDGVVLAVLRNLLIVNGERISYRALDVEQIGSVYEGIMGYAVRRIPSRCIGLKSKPQGAKKQLTTAVDLDGLLALPGGKRKAWLEEEAGTTLPPKSATALKDASSEAELLEALAPRINRDLFDGAQAAGGLVFQPTEERRRSGSHYTPRSLTRPIVEEALRPWLERCNHRPTAAQILDLKICDPAMGSGAFLVECCRYLAELLELAWTREGLPNALKPGGHAHGEEPLIYARRLIAQSCLYGVDKNPFAVNLARLSLWLVSLSKEAPFTFVDHALKCGDSLVGMERSEIEAALKGASLQRELQIEYLDQVRQQEARSFALFHADSRSDADDAQKRQALDELNTSTAYLRTVGDLLVAAFFNGNKPKDREDLKQLYLAATLQHSSADELKEDLAEPLERLSEGEKGIAPIHWQLSFPDVFGRENPGFDLLIGNPPYLGGAKIWGSVNERYPDWLRSIHSKSTGKGVDLIAHFFRRAFGLQRNGGVMAFLSTNNVFRSDTREAGLKQIAQKGGIFFSAKRRIPWLGDAGVTTCFIATSKGLRPERFLLDNKEVEGINSHLLPSPNEFAPNVLAENTGICFRGADIYGEGFLFWQDSPDYEGSWREASDIEKGFPEEKAAIRYFIGGKELTSHPRHMPHRKVIDFTGLSETDASTRFPNLFAVAEQRVKPGRNKLGGYSVADGRRERWWIYGTATPALNKAKESLENVLAISRTSKYTCFSILPAEYTFGDKLAVICTVNSILSLGLLSSSMHSIWAEFNGATRGDTLVYSSTDCFGTFPAPITGMWNSACVNEQLLLTATSVSNDFFELRTKALCRHEIGMTTFYNLFHDPKSDHAFCVGARKLQVELDNAFLDLYRWPRVTQERHGFALEYLDFGDDLSIDQAEISELLSENLFFEDVDKAVEFERRWRLLTGSDALLPWRYRWPDAVRDDVLARLLALNAERYAEEVAQGLHNKGAKQAAKAGGGAVAGKRRGRPPKAAQPGETEPMQAEQMGFGL